MVRSAHTLFGSSLFGMATVGVATLGFLWASPGQPTPPGKPQGEWRLLEPIRYENLTVFPVVSSTSYDAGAFLTLEEGLSRGEVLIQEQGEDSMIRDRGVVRPAVQSYNGPSVNQLVLINRSKRPLILLAGELVSGGKQDRVIGKDRIVPVGAPPLPLDVFCVEHGRWSNGANFVAAKTIVHPSVREKAAVDQAQTEVWNAVRSGSTAAAAPSAPAARLNVEVLSQAITSNATTESYEKVYSAKS